jgi:hypothetical protein
MRFTLTIPTRVVVAFSVFLAACGPGTAPEGQAPFVILTSRTGVEPVQKAFNDAADERRVILLLSPTCGTCLKGASVVEEVLKRYPTARVALFAVWQPMLPTDVSPPMSRTLARLGDGRVRQYWDADRLVAAQLGRDAKPPQPVPDCCTRKGVLWDLLAIYPSGDQWSATVPLATVFNGTIVDTAAELAKVLAVK